MSSNGASTNWPFLYQGGEKEFTDPGPLYYSGGGQFYSPQLVRSLSETSQTSSNGNNGGPAGNGFAAASGGGGFSPNFSPSLQESGEALGVGAGAAGATAGAIFAYNAVAVATEGATLGFATPVIVAFFVAEGLFELFDDLFGGGGSPPIPRQLLHMRHSLYDWILGVPVGLTPTEGSAAPDPSDVTSTNFISPVAFIIPFQSLPEDYNEPPGPEWEQRGPNWFNPKTRQSLHPDPNHGLPKGPHYDLHNRHPKWSLSIRPYNGGLQFWNEDLMEELPLEWLPLGLLP